MTSPASSSSPDANGPVKDTASRPAVAEGVPALAAWHGAWTAAVMVSTLGGIWLGALSGPAAFGSLAMLVPGLAGLALIRRDGTGERALVLVVWTVCALAAAVLSGGLGGPLTGFVTMPFVAGLALGGPRHGVRLAQGGALGAAIAAGSGQLSAWLIGAPRTVIGMATVSAVLAAVAAVLAVRLAWRIRETRLAIAEETTRRVEALLSSQPGLTLVLDASGRVYGAYGSAPPALLVDALFEQGLIAAVHAPDRRPILDAFDAALKGQPAQISFAPRQALDRRVTLIVRRADDAAGHPRLIAQAFDGTRQFATEIGLEAARAEAEAQNAGKTRFLANMSHELRTPLNAVLGFSDVMRQRLFGPLSPKYAEYADNIHEAGSHLLDLIGDVLDVSKIEAERYELSREPFDAREVVSAAVALVRGTATDGGVTLASLLPDDPLAVEADRRALKQITLNLLSNAIKFTPSGGSVTLTLETIGPYLEMVVADTGVGIAARDLKRLGRPFEQAGEADQRAKGTGLGLSLVRALAELHGGRMSIESTLGEGTAVTVRLPVVAVSQAAAVDGGAEIIQLNAGGAGPSPTV
ncbi:sensor histidine kinase [Brevundimonas subvibrioides]|uniref:histidine kinase n=1 Tax=Brevundimonas subvibrioides (strain ATCC 15264 / DSM 4735 / LMG 14903 / NBRC 16000 / CB 81) TaxID=633149 RepID=D9QF26_BRESC|nr:HAMP domain-containing sensor histidine kinase [Brevundimonas subvibrioides]ADL00511.1 integral membrane sensor signal transduction histidine kinase [Brevundimonas subvibrioides ATCC 15264]